MKSNQTTTPARDYIRNLSQGRGDLNKIHISAIKIDPGFNGRTEWGDITALAEDIQLNGLLQELVIRKPKDLDTLYLVDGERRHRAITHLLAQGIDIGPVPCIVEAQAVKPLDRLFSQLSLNSGKPFTLLEKARLYLRLQEEHAINGTEIARRAQSTKQAVSNALTLVKKGSAKLLKMIENGQLSATTALEIIKLHPDNRALQESHALNTLSAAATNHITPKDLKGGEASQSRSTGVPPVSPQESNATPAEESNEELAESSQSTVPSSQLEVEKLATGNSDEAATPTNTNPFKNVPNTSTGGNGGFSGGGNTKPEKRIRKLEDFLDESEPAALDQARFATIELLIDYLLGKQDITKIKNHLIKK